MFIIKQYLKGEITKEQLQDHLDANPELREAAEKLLTQAANDEMSDDELEDVAAAGNVVVQTDCSFW